MSVSRKLVKMKARQMWPDVDLAEIMEVLDRYGVDPYENGRERVQLAILKESQGDREKLPRLVEVAKSDPRDILAWAEYPEQTRTDVAEMRKMAPKEKKALLLRDRKQYLAWLEADE